MTQPAARQILLLHSADDEAFVRGYLAPALGLPLDAGEECPAGMALGSRQLAARPVRELARLVGESRYVVPVLSPSALADPWLQLSDELASHGAADDGDQSRGVIPLLLADCEVPLHLRAGVALDFRKHGDWEDEAARLRRELERPAVPPPELPCPYPGMRPFRDGDAAFFHGREEEIAEVVRRLEGGERELMVIGPSGSGKSSLIAAGVAPKLRGAWMMRSFRPGAEAVKALKEALGSHAVEDAVAALLLGRPERGLLVLVDQAEELFSLASAEERKRFAAALRVLREEERCAVIMTLRADFFGELLGSELWSEGLKQHLDLAPMRGEALRKAIEEPARQHHVFLEKALVDRLLADAADEPGALPLLQEALVQLWSARRQRLLTLDEYRAHGGLSAALVQHADRTLAAMAEARQQLAKRVLLRLVAFGEGRPHTRRRQTREALRGEEQERELDAVLMALSQARLVIMDGEGRLSGSASAISVDLCHDILITAWPSFSSWVEARRTAEQQRRRWQEHARAWIARGRGEGAQLDAGELAEAKAWSSSAEASSVGVDPEIAALIAASEHALRTRLLRRRRRIATTIASLASFTVVSLLLATCAFLQRREARSQERRAVAARGETAAQLSRNRALLAAQYEDAARRFLVEERPQRALPYLLAARKESGEPPSPIVRALFRAASRTRVQLALQSTGELLDLAYSGDGKILLTASSDGTARRWRAGDGAMIGEPMRHPSAVQRGELSPDGGRALTVTADGAVHLWDDEHYQLALAEPAMAAHFSRDGALIVTASGKEAQLWDAATGAPLGRPRPHDLELLDAQLSPDGNFLVALPAGSSQLTVWALEGDDAPRRIGPASEPSAITSFAFDPRGERIAITFANMRARYARVTSLTHPDADGGKRYECSVDSTNNSAYLFEGGVALVCPSTVEIFRGEEKPRELRFTLPVSQSLLGGDHRSLAVLTMDGTAHVWDLITGRLRARFENRFGSTLAASPDGDHFAIGELYGSARIWSLPQPDEPRLFAIPMTGRDVEVSHDGSWLAIASAHGVHLTSTALDEEMSLIRFRGDTPWRIAISPDDRWIAVQTMFRGTSLCERASRRCAELQAGIGRPADETAEVVSPLAFSPDSHLLAVPSAAMEVQLWDLRTRSPVGPALRHAPRSAARADLVSLRFSPDSRRLVSAASDGTARIFDVTSQQPIGEALTHEKRSALTFAFYSPDGTSLVTTDVDGTIEVRDAVTLRRTRSLHHDSRVMAAVFSKGGETLATLGADFRSSLWDFSTGKRRHVLQQPNWITRLAFSPDGTRLVSVGEEMRLWSAATGQALTPPLFHNRPAGEPSYPADAHAAYDLENQRVDNERVYDLDFSPDGRWLFTIARDGTLRKWDISFDEGSMEEWKKLVERSPFPTL